MYKELAHRNLFVNAAKRMEDFLEKQKKGSERQKKVLEYQKYVKKQISDKLEHREEFLTKAKDHNIVWARSNLKKIKSSFEQS